MSRMPSHSHLGWPNPPLSSSQQEKPQISPHTDAHSDQLMSAGVNVHPPVGPTEGGMTLSTAVTSTTMTEETLLPLVMQQLQTAYPHSDHSSTYFKLLAKQQTQVMLQELYNHSVLNSMQNLNLHHTPVMSQSLTVTTAQHSKGAEMHKGQVFSTAPEPQELIVNHRSLAADSGNAVSAQVSQSVLTDNGQQVSSKSRYSRLVEKTRNEQHNPRMQKVLTHEREKVMGDSSLSSNIPQADCTSALQSPDITQANYNSFNRDTEDWEEEILPYPQPAVGYSKASDRLLMSNYSNLSTEGQQNTTAGRTVGDSKRHTSCSLKDGRRLKEDRPLKTAPGGTTKTTSNPVPVEPKSGKSQSWTKVGKQGKPKKKSQK